MPRTVDKDKKAKDIARAALEVFRERGFHNARMVDIAEAAGIGKGTVYEYFRDKLGILQFELDQYFLAFKEGIAGAVSCQATPGKQLISLVDFAFEHVAEWEEHCAVFVDYFSVARTGRDPALSLKEIYGEMRFVLTALIENAQASGEVRAELDPVAVAELLVSIFDGVVLHGVFTERACGIQSLKDVAIGLLSSGIMVRAKP
jgi:TetR/AcrR family acrAB operon transcriptional repressor